MGSKSCYECNNKDLCAILFCFQKAMEESPTLPVVDSDDFEHRLYELLGQDCLYYN